MYDSAVMFSLNRIITPVPCQEIHPQHKNIPPPLWSTRLYCSSDNPSRGST